MTPNAVLLDMDGVLTVSLDPVPGAVEAVARLKSAGLPLRILTSTTAYTRAAIAGHLRRLGFAIESEEIQTAPVAAAAYLRTAVPSARVLHLGDASREDLQGIDLVGADDEPDVVLLSGADPSYGFDTMNQALRAVRHGSRLVAMHRNLSWMTNEGECLDAGAYLVGLERTTGVTATVTGKPSPAFFETALDTLRLGASEVAMVGDDVENDVLAAQSLGITGILVRTGKYRDDALGRASGAPDHVVASVADVPGLLGVGL